MSAESNGQTAVGAVGRDRKGRFAGGNPWAWPPGTSGNPKGRPTTHDELREFIQHVAAERAGAGDFPEWPRLYLMLRDMLLSKNASDHVAILEHGWGKVPQAIELSAGEALIQQMRDLGLAPTDVAADPVLVELFGIAGIKVNEDASGAPRS